jgi:hypothetical protein
MAYGIYTYTAYIAYYGIWHMAYGIYGIYGILWHIMAYYGIGAGASASKRAKRTAYYTGRKLKHIGMKDLR